MKKAPRPQVSRKKTQREQLPPNQSMSGPGAGPLIAWPWNAWATGFRWLELWLRASQSLVDAVQSGSARLDAAGDTGEERRRVPGLPWMPRVEATVIPLRRRTDPPASEATHISMRVLVPSLPWDGAAGNVLALDALVPRPDPGVQDGLAAHAAKASPASRKTEG